VAQLQTALVQEQKRVWKQVKAMKANHQGVFAANGKAAPSAPKEALLQRASASQVKFATRQSEEDATTTTAATTTTTTTSESFVQVQQVQHPLRMRPQEAPSLAQVSSGSGSKQGTQSGSWAHGSDLHIVQAAQLPAASVDDEDASGAEAGSGDDEDSGAKATGDAASEDSAATGAEDAKGECADNDDLEQILLQQSAKVRRSSDAVELPNPVR